jgi:hypothetical protein
LSHSVRNKGRLTKSSISADRERKRTNKKLEEWIIKCLGVEEMRNPYTNSRGTITPLQISKQVPDSILQSYDDILNTMYNMQEKGLLEEVVVKVGYGQLEYETEETPFRITPEGIIQFRLQYLRPVARLVVNHEEQYQTKVDKTIGDPEVKAEFKKVPEKLRSDPNVKAALEKISESGKSKVKAKAKAEVRRIIDNLENKAIKILIDTGLRHGSKPVSFFLRLVGVDLDVDLHLSDLAK